MTSETTRNGSAWPYWTLFFCGHFGRATAASRRLNRATIGSLMLLAATTVAAPVLDSVSPHGKLILIPGAAASATWIVLAYRRYFAELDELSRRIQHEAIAFAFGSLMLLGVTAAAATVVTNLTVHPLWLVMAEPLRGLGLVLAARRYQ